MTSMAFPRGILAVVLVTLWWANATTAQGLQFLTVDRPPFSMDAQGQTGFSIDLMTALAAQLNQDITFQTVDSFQDMLSMVARGEADGAIANISITAAREEMLDFTLPIFASGVQLMVSGDDATPLWRQIVTPQIGTYLAVAGLFLFVCGMLMWLFERKAQPYFDRAPKEALFPSFWWALNLVVNGGFEERQPRTWPGRMLAVVLVFSSLFIVSIFVAQISAALTVNALTSNVTGLNDLDTRRVGSVAGSTASDFLNARSVRHTAYDGYAEMIQAFETGDVSVVVYDGPLLRYYLQQAGSTQAYLVDHVFRVEDYGIALPTNSPLREPLNQSILTFREDGHFDELVRKWFGDW